MRKKPVSTSAVVKHRPLWRRFGIDEIEAAAEHVKKGGLAALATDRGEIELMLPRTRGGELPELAHWVLLALDLERWQSERSGPARDLVTARVDHDRRETVAGWCDRDEGRAGHAERIELDCLACGACCRQSRVVLQPSDRAALRRAGRTELDGSAYLKTDKGEIVLRRAPSGACIHFGAGNRCAIYDLRPQGCRVFPVASEPCLAVRRAVLGVSD